MIWDCAVVSPKPFPDKDIHQCCLVCKELLNLKNSPFLLLVIKINQDLKMYWIFDSRSVDKRSSKLLCIITASAQPAPLHIYPHLKLHFTLDSHCVTLKCSHHKRGTPTFHLPRVFAPHDVSCSLV